ncbi:MAG TPA: F0F1 ATP synthase subunit A, partial [Candidatus Binataceae bacterium]|nr:F0F1 ATP synthase subunit A [Candidatus Binataceae bacterium]
MNESPLRSTVLFHLGFIPVSGTVATTWGLMAAIAAGCWLATRGFRVIPKQSQAMIETAVFGIEEQIAAIVGRDASPFLALLGTLFIFLVVANLSGVLPGIKAPTAAIETPAALATIVFLSVHYYGIRFRGLVPYLKGYLKPNPFMLPLNILSEITRSFSLGMRLFGNIMS